MAADDPTQLPLFTRGYCDVQLCCPNNPEQQRTSLADLACGGVQPGKNDFKISAMIPPKANPTIHFNSNKSLLSGASSICLQIFFRDQVSVALRIAKSFNDRFGLLVRDA
jgi:hypothetical protein